MCKLFKVLENLIVNQQLSLKNYPIFKPIFFIFIMIKKVFILLFVLPLKIMKTFLKFIFSFF